MVISMTMTMAMMAAALKVGTPKWNGVVTPNQGASADPAEVGEAEDRPDDRADDQADQDGDRRHKPPEEPVDARG